MAKSDNEWEQRILCSDGNCIGIIGADGRCRACGLPYAGELPLPAADPEAADDDADGSTADSQDMIADAQPGDDPATVSDESHDAWDNRTLCVDESCIGIIGPDGRCKECGKPYPG